jgi:hypothetical protein
MMGLLVLAILAARDRFFLGGLGCTGGFMVSLLLTLFKTASNFAVALSFSVGASCAVGLLVTSTVILRWPSRGCNGPSATPGAGFRCGDVGGNIKEEEFDEIFCPLSVSEPSTVSKTSWIASRLFDPGSLAAGSEGVEV